MCLQPSLMTGGHQLLSPRPNLSLRQSYKREEVQGHVQNSGVQVHKKELHIHQSRGRVEYRYITEEVQCRYPRSTGWPQVTTQDPPRTFSSPSLLLYLPWSLDERQGHGHGARHCPLQSETVFDNLELSATDGGYVFFILQPSIDQNWPLPQSAVFGVHYLCT